MSHNTRDLIIIVFLKTFLVNLLINNLIKNYILFTLKVK